LALVGDGRREPVSSSRWAGRAARRRRAGPDRHRLDPGRDHRREGEPRLDPGYTLVNGLGFANILPVGLALYSRAAPRRLEGLVIGVYYLHLFIGNTFVGWLAGFLETMPGRQFWALHAGLVACAGVLLLACKLVFGKLLAPDDAVGP
jgi:hypothetical protein